MIQRTRHVFGSKKGFGQWGGASAQVSVEADTSGHVLLRMSIEGAGQPETVMRLRVADVTTLSAALSEAAYAVRAGKMG